MTKIWEGRLKVRGQSRPRKHFPVSSLFFFSLILCHKHRFRMIFRFFFIIIIWKRISHQTICRYEWSTQSQCFWSRIFIILCLTRYSCYSYRRYSNALIDILKSKHRGGGILRSKRWCRNPDEIYHPVSTMSEKRGDRFQQAFRPWLKNICRWDGGKGKGEISNRM